MRPIDLNSDLGEGMTTDAEVMDSITSANVACGAHAGDEATMARTVALAKERGLTLGAHPGYPDRENFGRTPLRMDDEDLARSIVEQIERLVTDASPPGRPVRYVEAHGAPSNHPAPDAPAAR